MKRNWALLLLFAALLPGLLIAQDEPKKGRQKIVIIKKSVDEDGNKVVEKIVREGEEGEVLEWEGEDGEVIIRLGDGDVEWHSLEDMDIDIDLEGLDMELEERLEGLNNIDVELEELDGRKNLRIRIEPDGEVIEWQGLGDLPEALEERLESRGLHFKSLDGEDFIFSTPPNRAMLGVQVGQTIEMAHENGDVEKIDVLDGNGTAVQDVFAGSAAEEAGIRKGDIITAIDGQPVGDYKGLVKALSDKAPGDKVSVGLNRAGQLMDVEATLKGRADAPRVFKFRAKEEEGETPLPELREEKPELELEAFEAFPNPAENQLTVRFTGEQAPVTVMLLDAAGKQLYKEYIQDFGGNYDQQIGLEGVPEGMLLLTIEQEGRVFVEKVMVARQ
ncbi:MAG: PDZ domain-containing protein [Phaeodactylibacter sp.]|nr:PDZ domain-containing protein [Phaeodactylibacter sp.]